MKKIISAILLLCTILTLLAACTGENQDNGNNDPTTPDNGDSIKGIDIRDYTIVRPDGAGDLLMKYVPLFQSELLRYTKADLAVSTDYETTGEGVKEILLGNTNRAESTAASEALKKAPENAYVIRATEDKIVVSAKSDEGLVRAMKYFLMTYAADCNSDNYVSLEVGKSDSGKVNLDSLLFDNYTEMSLTRTSIIATSIKDFTGICAYETLIELGHNGDNNGTLYASFATYSEQGYRIYKSTDEGKTWTHISTAKDTYNNSLTDPENPTKHIAKGYCLQPCLFELPKDMGDFKEGTLFLGACTTGEGYYKGEKVSTTGMALYYSLDLGLNWTPYCNVDLAGNDPDDTGVWEPYFIFEEETGRVYCYYSDESNEIDDKYGPKAQKLVFKYTTDMKTWIGKDGKTGVTDEPFIVANCTINNMRPGMISIAEMGNGEYFMTYELCGVTGCPVFYRTTTNLAEWPDVSTTGKQVIGTKGETIGSAPWCAWTPAGGECGTLFVIGDHEKLFMSFDYGKTFITITNPMYVGQGSSDKTSYSPYLGFSADGRTLYYLDNPQDKDISGVQHVKFQSIKIW